MMRKRCGGNWERFSEYVVETNWPSIFANLDLQLPSIEFSQPSWFLSDRSALRAFVESGKRFNSEWSRFVDSGIVDQLNDQRMAYNRDYPIEKACAFGTDAVLEDFEPLPMLTREWFESQYPLLSLPALY
ncbi:hypothetical protein LOC67_17210 [Stieleria sp. JC731]|uniref:hypothetical protein n=1 Tax=Pirellulaceae TaxID=2691357 RepID=UPI001E4F35E7|nr:hypothetical protein [Stieleria sp. JC731]MCC9602296.1 hypothetical protein [Stieleria sp. JC731]